MVPTPKNMALAHLDPMWPTSAQNPGGMWVLMCVCVYNQGYKALSLLITILASVAMNRLLSRGPLGIGSVRVCVFEWRSVLTTLWRRRNPPMQGPIL